MQKPPRSLTLAHWVDPAEIFAALYAELPYAFWLDAGSGATRGISYIGEGNDLIEAGADGVVTIASLTTPGSAPERFHGSVLSALGARRRAHSGERHHVTQPLASGAHPVSDFAQSPQPRLNLGWVGWLGYESLHDELGIDQAPAGEDAQVPVAAWMRADVVVACDHERRLVTVTAATPEQLKKWSDRWQAAQPLARPDDIDPSMDADVDATNVRAASDPAWRQSDDRYLALIDACQAHIYEGDAYQLCLTNRVTQSLAEGASDVAVFARLRATSPSHHSGLIRMGATSLISSSPEQFLAVSSSGRLSTKPIKGTRPRGSTPALDSKLAEELLASEKERAENLMIVDLMRNDLTRVCERGSVTVSALHRVESYAQVHQLVSTVEGQLAEGLDALDAVRACFPAGSMTGTPKVAAMRRLANLEGARRGIYAGAFGYLSDDGAADLAMVIRSIVLTQHPRGGSTATIGTGGGITSDSVPSEELDEIKIKARALLAALR